jgi:cytoskeleton protein RodZ
MTKDGSMINEETNGGAEAGNSQVGFLGEFLKQKRIDKNFSLEKLSQKTKISINILRSLETNDYKQLPSAAYIKGFVISYVKVLGLPIDEAINKMEYTYLHVLGKPFPALNHTKQMNTTASRSQNSHQAPQEVIESSESIMENTKSFLPVLIFAVVILVFVGGYKIISSVIENEVNGQKIVDHGPKIESSSALVKQPAPKEAPVEETLKAETNAEGAKEEATAETPVEPKKKVPELVRNFPEVNFKKIRGKLFSVKTAAPENDNLELLPEKIKKANNPDLQNIYIKAVDGNTWLSYKIDNKPIESAIISQGGSLFLQGSEIRLFLGNVNVTRIFYNNYLIDAPTKSGVKSLIFPEESNVKYSLPLFPKANDDILYTSEEYTKRMELEQEELKKRQQ